MAAVLNTRPAYQAAALSGLLRAAGFEPVDVPLVDVIPDLEGLGKLRRLQPLGFTGIFLSSPNGLRHLAKGLLPVEAEPWLAKPFYLVGGKAAGLVQELGGRVAFHPKESSLDGFLKEFTPGDIASSGGGRGPAVAGLVMAQRWLHPCSASTRLDPAAFRKKNIDVENVPVYRPGLHPEASAGLAALGPIDAAVFCSGSAVEHFYQSAPRALSERLGRKDGILAISIGPSTSKVLADKGVEYCREAKHADDESLVDALKLAFGSRATRVIAKNPETKP